jgi:hypothetical protein
MFIKNKYTNLYFSLINSRQLISRSKNDSYYELHHIIPKCLGGNNKKENLVLLTAKEHYICHLLLIKMTEGKSRAKMCLGLKCLSQMKNKNQQRKLTSRMFERFRLEANKSISVNHADFSGNKNPMYGKESPNKGVKMSSDQKQKISLSLKGRVLDSKHKENISLKHWSKNGIDPWNKGKKLGKNGTIWINNGVVNLKIKSTTPLPDGYVKGRIMKCLNLDSNH